MPGPPRASSTRNCTHQRTGRGRRAAWGGAGCSGGSGGSGCVHPRPPRRRDAGCVPTQGPCRAIAMWALPHRRANGSKRGASLLHTTTRRATSGEGGGGSHLAHDLAREVGDRRVERRVGVVEQLGQPCVEVAHGELARAVRVARVEERAREQPARLQRGADRRDVRRREQPARVRAARRRLELGRDRPPCLELEPAPTDRARAGRGRRTPPRPEPPRGREAPTKPDQPRPTMRHRRRHPRRQNDGQR